MKPFYIIILLGMFTLGKSAPAIQLLASGTTKSDVSKKSRPTRSHGADFDFILNADWNYSYLNYNLPLSYELSTKFPPLVSNLDYRIHGPALSTEQQKTEPSTYAYKRQLFFGDIPHVKLVLENQRLRRFNNLPPIVLGSIRQGHPFSHHNQI